MPSQVDLIFFILSTLSTIAKLVKCPSSEMSPTYNNYMFMLKKMNYFISSYFNNLWGKIVASCDFDN